MAPPEAFVGGVGVEDGVAVQVVVAVRRNPFIRVALHGQNAAISENIFKPLGSLEAAVRELTMEREGDTKAAGNEVGAEE